MTGAGAGGGGALAAGFLAVGAGAVFGLGFFIYRHSSVSAARTSWREPCCIGLRGKMGNIEIEGGHGGAIKSR